MLGFPDSTVFNKRITKSKFYTHLNVSNKLEQLFVKEIDTIYWRNKLSPETINIEKGSIVEEIQVIEIELKQETISQSLIELIDREIPYHIVFILKRKDKGQIWISYKEASKSREGKFKVDSFYKTDWMEYNELSLNIAGLNLDKVYENFMQQVAGDRLQFEDGMSIEEVVDRAKEIEKLERDIDRIKNRIMNEKQFNHQVKLMRELRKLKAELENCMK